MEDSLDSFIFSGGFSLGKLIKVDNQHHTIELTYNEPKIILSKDSIVSTSEDDYRIAKVSIEMKKPKKPKNQYIIPDKGIETVVYTLKFIQKNNNGIPHWYEQN